MTGHDADPQAAEPMGPDELAAALERRTDSFRTRILQVALLVAFVVRPLPIDVVARLRAYADALGVRDDMVDVAERFAEGALELAKVDFSRNGYLGSLDPRRLAALHTRELDSSWGPWSTTRCWPTVGPRWANCR